MTKPVSVQWGLEIALTAVIVGAVMFFAGLSDSMKWWLDLGGWGFWSGGAGLMLMILGSIWSIMIYNRIHKFHELMAERSKAVFVRSLDELEYTAWRLPQKFDVLLAQKKDDMGVK